MTLLRLKDRAVSPAWFLLPLALLWGYGLGRREPTGAAAPDVLSAPARPPAVADYQVVPVGFRALRESISAAGNLTVDPNRQAVIGSPVSGRLSEVLGQVGTRVSAGQAVAVLQSPELTRAQAEHHHARLAYRLALGTLSQRKALIRLGDASQRPVEEARVETANVQSEREIAASNLELTRKKLRREQQLFEAGVTSRTMVDEAQSLFDQAQSRWMQTRRLSQLAHKHRSREEVVAGRQLLFQPKLMEAEHELALSEQEVEHTGQMLQDLGMPPEQESSGLVLRAPSSGVIVEQKATRGQAVSADQELFRVVDSSQLWLWLQIYEKDMSRVRSGLPVSLSVEGLPGKFFSGRISYLGAELDPATHTQSARVQIDNPSGRLKIGMFAHAVVWLAPTRRVLWIPLEAVQTEEGRPVVYVQSDGGDHFRAQPVTLGVQNSAQGWCEVRAGLRPGQRIVAQGSVVFRDSGVKP